MSVNDGESKVRHNRSAGPMSLSQFRRPMARQGDKMGHESRAKRTITSREYIKDNFEPSDRLAVVIKRRQKDGIVQRLVTAEQLAGPRFQAWLRFENAHAGDAYLSM